MKIKSFVLFKLSLLLFLSSTMHAQSWQWVKTVGGIGNSYGHAIASDQNGNIYSTGSFSDTAHFGNFTLTSPGLAYIFIVKSDSSGKVLWATKASGISQQDGLGISVDTLGNIYITGYFRSTVYFDTIALTSKGLNDIFLARYSKDGKALWARRAGGKFVDKGFAVKACARTVYLTGCFSDTSDFSNVKLSSAGITDIFIAKYDTSGNLLWTKRGGGADDDFGKGITTDSDENVVLTGTFGSDLGDFNGMPVVGAGMEDVFLSKIDSSGNVLWYKQAGGDDSDGGTGITTDKNNNICISGYFYSSIINFGTSASMNNYGSGDIFLAKYNSSGNLLWTRHAGGLEYDFATDVEADAEGNFCITGAIASESAAFENLYIYKTSILNTNREIFAAAYDSSGNILWANHGGGLGNCESVSLCLDKSGNPLISGWLQSTATFGSITIPGNGYDEAYIAKLSSFPTSILSSESPRYHVQFAGNPFHASTELIISNELLKKFSYLYLELYDASGMKVENRLINSTHTSIENNKFASGIYFYILKSKTEILASGKLIVE